MICISTKPSSTNFSASFTNSEVTEEKISIVLSGLLSKNPNAQASCIPGFPAFGIVTL